MVPELSGALLHGGTCVLAPAESMVFAAAHEIGADDAGVIPIGRPLANTVVFVLDSSLRPVPSGVVGKVRVGGLGLADGYLGRLFRAGDLARWNGSGVLELVGRAGVAAG